MTADSSDCEDKRWVAMTKAGNSTTFTKIAEKYRQPVYNLCYRMLADSAEAEDAAQEVFIRAFFKLNSYDETRKFSTWLFSIASHYCIDKLRAHRLKFVSWDDISSWYSFPAQETSQPEKVLLKTEANQEVYKLLKALPADYRAAIILKYWHYKSYQDIAQVLDTTVSAIKSKLFRARKMMAQAAIQQERATTVTPRLSLAPSY